MPCFLLYRKEKDAFWKKLGISEQVGKFTDIKKDGVSHWVGLKIKVEDNITQYSY